ncbi:MAG: hypothetical protein FJZ57_04800, partial [Chlamydiae bacterium]|nr:hypothetical protein [Chlamydiota bacterium]
MAKKNQIEETKVEKEMTAIREEALQKQEVRKTFLELVQILSKEESFEVSGNQMLVIEDMNIVDFIDASSSLDLTARLDALGKAFNKYSLDLILEGSIGLGEFNIADYSWNILPGTSGKLVIKARPATLKKNITDLVSFLKLLPSGQGFVLKPGQDLLIQGLSKESMMDYYDSCKDDDSVEKKDKGQDELFEKNCSLLKDNKLL